MFIQPANFHQQQSVLFSFQMRGISLRKQWFAQRQHVHFQDTFDANHRDKQSDSSRMMLLGYSVMRLKASRDVVLLPPDAFSLPLTLVEF
jgi:hypothetical protein